MPPDSLGRAFALLLQQEGMQLIERPEGLESLADDDQYLQLRARACHNIWHLITGFPNTLPGEVALNGFGAPQLRQPGPVLLLAADLMARAHVADTVPDLADAVSFGLRLGGGVRTTAGAALGGGLDAPAALADWRQQLGITKELRLSPFASGVTASSRTDGGGRGSQRRQSLLCPGPVTSGGVGLCDAGGHRSARSDGHPTGHGAWLSVSATPRRHP